MSACIRYMTWLLAIAVLTTESSLAVEVPPQVFSIGNATVGVTTLEDVQNSYGLAPQTRVGQEDEADVARCYAHTSPKGTAFLSFESGVMGGAKRRITGFRLSESTPHKKCVPTAVDIWSLATGNGVHLGQALTDFHAKVPLTFVVHGSELSLEEVSRRKATPEELRKLRAKWPNEQDDYFDVAVTITAKFHGGKLVNFYVRKIESF